MQLNAQSANPGLPRRSSARSPSSSPRTSGGASSTSAAPRRSSRSSSSSRNASPSSTAAARCRAGRWSGRWPTMASCRPAPTSAGARSRPPTISLSPTSSRPTEFGRRRRRSGAGRRHRRPVRRCGGSVIGGARRRHQRQEGRGQRHLVGGQCPHHRGGSAGRRLCPQEGRQLGRRRRRRLVGRLRRGRRRPATRTPRSARSSSSPISTPTSSWSPSSAAFPPTPRRRRRRRNRLSSGISGRRGPQGRAFLVHRDGNGQLSRVKSHTGHGVDGQNTPQWGAIETPTGRHRDLETRPAGPRPNRVWPRAGSHPGFHFPQFIEGIAACAKAVAPARQGLRVRSENSSSSGASLLCVN